MDCWHCTVFSSPSDQFSFSSFCQKLKDLHCTKSKSISHAKEIFSKLELGEIIITKCTPLKIWEQPMSNRIYKPSYTWLYVKLCKQTKLFLPCSPFLYLCLHLSLYFFLQLLFTVRSSYILNKLVVNLNLCWTNCMYLFYFFFEWRRENILPWNILFHKICERTWWINLLNNFIIFRR